MYQVQPSTIHGMGLFATGRIEEGEILGQLEGHWVTEDGAHVLWVDETRGYQVSNIFRYINHHAAPNAAYYDDLTVVALRAIEAGEEITHDYGGDGLPWEEVAPDDCLADAAA